MVQKLQDANEFPGVQLEGLYTHFADSFDDLEITRAQIQAFQNCTAPYTGKVDTCVLRHVHPVLGENPGAGMLSDRFGVWLLIVSTLAAVATLLQLRWHTA